MRRLLPRRHYLAVPALALITVTPLQATLPAQSSTQALSQVSAAASSPQVQLASWDSSKQLRTGTFSGTAVQDGALTVKNRSSKRKVGNHTYGVSTWTSPWRKTGFQFDELVASWSATTPGNSLVEIKVRGRRGSTDTSWDTLARWAGGDRHLKRRSFTGQDDDQTMVNVDTWVASRPLSGYQVRVEILRKLGDTTKPSVDLVTGMASRLPATTGPTSKPGTARGTVLNVPRYSQMQHRGHYPQWGNGGEAWCSPTSISMVLGYYRSLPRAQEYDWVKSGHVDPWVDFAARRTYDYAYEGTGNWPFNTAYAARYAGKAFVTRLRSLREAERFIDVGIPLVISLAFDKGELDGAPIQSSNGHLLVIAGFTKSGAVVVNDPAAANKSGVRRTYRRDQVERLWLRASGGLTYVVRDSAHPLPNPSDYANW